MYTLATGETLAAAASAASAITLTIWGMERNTTTNAEEYKTLYQGQPGVAAATIYTVPAGKEGFVRKLTAVNTDTANDRAFQLFRGGTAAANAILPSVVIPKGGWADLGEHGWRAYTNAGQVMQTGYAGAYQEAMFGPAGCKAETIPRNVCTETNTAVGATGVLNMQAIYLQAGAVIGNISLFSATTAAGTPTNYRFGLYDSGRNLLAESANQLNAAWAANSIKTLPLTAPYTVPVSGLYYIGYYMTATTVPTLKGNTARVANQLAGTAPAVQGTSSTGLTTALPNPAGVITASNASFWACVT